MRSIAHATVIELDAHIDAVLQAKAQYRQLMGDVSASNFDVFCSPLLMPPVSMLFCALRIVICHPGWLCYLCTGISSIYLPKNFAIAWLYATISPCCVCHLHVMVVVLHLLLLTLWIGLVGRRHNEVPYMRKFSRYVYFVVKPSIWIFAFKISQIT